MHGDNLRGVDFPRGVTFLHEGSTPYEDAFERGNLFILQPLLPLTLGWFSFVFFIDFLVVFYNFS